MPGTRPRFQSRRFLAIAVVLLAIPPFLAVVEVPGESKVKDALGVSVRSPVQPCGEVRHRGDPKGPWRSLPKLDGVRDEARAAVIGDSIYLVGGLTSLDLSVEPGTADSVNTFERYDVTTGRYTPLPPLPASLNHVGAVAYGGDVYVVGGYNDQLGRAEATGDAWRYRPSERRWTPIAPMPTRRGGHGLVVVDDRMYAVGGRNGAERPQRVDVYDFRSGRWSEAAPIPTPRDHIGVGVDRGLIYAAGGRQENDYSLGAFERYDVARDRWERLPDIPRPASSFELIEASGLLVAPSGGDALAKPYWISGQTWAYDPRRERWSELARMPQPKHGYAGAAIGDRIYLFGGSRCGAFRATDTAETLHIPPA